MFRGCKCATIFRNSHDYDLQNVDRCIVFMLPWTTTASGLPNPTKRCILFSFRALDTSPRTWEVHLGENNILSEQVASHSEKTRHSVLNRPTSFKLCPERSYLYLASVKDGHGRKAFTGNHGSTAPTPPAILTRGAGTEEVEVCSEKHGLRS